MRLTRRQPSSRAAPALGAGLVIGFRLPLDAARSKTPGVFAPQASGSGSTATAS